MAAPPNIYSVVVFDLKPKVKDYIDKLNDAGQIDLDENGYPYLVKVEQQGPNHVCHIVRNGKMENFILNTRRKSDPITSWNGADGYKRTGGKKVVVVSTNSEEKPRGERAKRRSFESFRRLTNQLLQG